jgi:hypothetical protein
MANTLTCGLGTLLASLVLGFDMTYGNALVVIKCATEIGILKEIFL